jgi:hypothetical protein
LDIRQYNSPSKVPESKEVLSDECQFLPLPFQSALVVGERKYSHISCKTTGVFTGPQWSCRVQKITLHFSACFFQISLSDQPTPSSKKLPPNPIQVQHQRENFYVQKLESQL